MIEEGGRGKVGKERALRAPFALFLYCTKDIDACSLRQRSWNLKIVPDSSRDRRCEGQLPSDMLRKRTFYLASFSRYYIVLLALEGNLFESEKSVI